MGKMLLGLGSAALIAIASYLAARAAQPEQPPPGASTTTETISTTASEPDRDTQLRLAKMDTSPAAFRKLDKDNDGRISPLEAAENPKVAAAFTLGDRDKDGYLSPEEFAALSSAPHR